MSSTLIFDSIKFNVFSIIYFNAYDENRVDKKGLKLFDVLWFL